MVDMLSSSGFQEKVLLLVLAALMSGLLIPYVLRHVDARKTIEQMHRQAWLARQSKLIESQAELLNCLARALWDWRYAAMRVSYYGAQSDASDFKDSWQTYTKTVWAILSDIRYHTSRSRWLISETAFDRLITLYHQLIELDMQLYRACHLTDEIKRNLELGDLNQYIFDVVTKNIDELLAHVAQDVMLDVRAGSMPQAARIRHEPNDIATARPS